MQRGLQGRRIALFVSGTAADRGDPVRAALDQAGATTALLDGQSPTADWRGDRYAAVVAVGQQGSGAFEGHARLTQMLREFLASEKPIVVIGSAVHALMEAGGVEGREVATNAALADTVRSAGGAPKDEPVHVDDALITVADAGDLPAAAARATQALTSRLEEHDLDEMSDMSFPASDPPSTSPASIGRAAPDADADPGR